MARRAASRWSRSFQGTSRGPPMRRYADMNQRQQEILMPELSRFLGIVIGMFYREHGVPHFHAVYGEHEISVEVETGRFAWVFLPGPETRGLE